MKTFDDYYKEIKQNIIVHWTREGHSVRNMENDPVVNLLLSALSYQAYHIHNKIEQLEHKTIREFRDRTLPYHLLKPVPAFSIAETKLTENCPEKIMDETCIFEFQNSKKQKITFVPLLNTKLIDAELKMAYQLEENVWRVQLQATTPISNLSGLSFYLDTDALIEIENITYCGKQLPLIKPSQFNELPFTKWFNNTHLFLNQNYYLFGAFDYWQEAFLNHAAKMYYVGDFHTQNEATSNVIPHTANYIPHTTLELDVTFNTAINSNNFMKINCIPVVNVEKFEITVDERNPVRDLTADSGQFLNLIYNEAQQNDYENILIRQFNVERYNSHQLFEQMQEMLYRYNSDYYAFQNNRELRNGDILQNLQFVMEDIRNVVNKLDDKMLQEHYYAILTRNNPDIKKVDLKYLTTAGASANGIKKDEKAVKTPVSLNNSKTVLLLETKGGRDAVKDEAQKEALAKYYHHTKDRLVTPADIIIFVKTFYFENVKFGDEIENVSVKREDEHISVTVNLKVNSYLKASDKRTLLSKTLQNQISLRSSGILPFQVMING
jgi:hypothetical protein